MNNLLWLFSGFQDTLWQIALLIAGVVLIGYCLKFKNGKIIIISMLFVVLIGYTTYCGVQLNDYYRAKGGIYGKLVSLYKPNDVVITNSVSYSFKNLNLTADGDLYSAKITSDEVLDFSFDENATYGVYVNNIPCNYVEIGQDYVFAKYRYVFYDDEFNVLMDDTLSFKFAFYTNSTYLSVSTSGGAEAVKYWNNFFNKNVFNVTIDNKGYSYSEDITFGTGDISDYSVVSYYIGEELFVKQVYKNGNKINLPSDSNYFWTFDNQEKVTNDFVVSENIMFYATPFTLTFDSNGSSDKFESRLLYYAEVYGELPTPQKEGYVFNGWYTDITGGDMVISTTSMENSNITLYARWSEITYTIQFDANGGSGTMSNQTFTYGEAKALSSNAFIRNGYKFVGWSTSLDGEVTYGNCETILNITSKAETITLYAIWSDSYYTAHVYLMNASGGYATGYSKLTIPSQPGVVDITEDANTSTYVVENGIALDKITDLDGNEITTIEVAEDNSTIVNFYYKRIQHTLYVNANGGSFLYLKEWTFNDDYTTAYTSKYYGREYGTLPVVTRYGYNFIGWFTSLTDGTQVSLTTSMDIEDVTLYAYWEEDVGFDNTSVNLTTFNIDLEKLATCTNTYYKEAHGTDLNIDIDSILYVDYCDNNQLKLVGYTWGHYGIWTMTYTDKTQSITEIIEAQQDFEFNFYTLPKVDSDLIMYALYYDNADDAIVSYGNKEEIESGYKYHFIIHIFSEGICYEHLLSFTSDSILTDTQVNDKLTTIFEGNVYSNEEIEISKTSETQYLKINNTYILNY